jgi:hypothetical protein
MIQRKPKMAHVKTTAVAAPMGRRDEASKPIVQLSFNRCDGGYFRDKITRAAPECPDPAA